VIVAGVAKDNGVDLVLDTDKTVYVSGGTDLTDAVLKSFKKVDVDSSNDSDSKKK
jgi:Skp family chaperone for outer membrane proteins